jgi:hypothetical protein
VFLIFFILLINFCQPLLDIGFNSFFWRGLMFRYYILALITNFHFANAFHYFQIMPKIPYTMLNAVSAKYARATLQMRRFDYDDFISLTKSSMILSPTSVTRNTFIIAARWSTYFFIRYRTSHSLYARSAPRSTWTFYHFAVCDFAPPPTKNFAHAHHVPSASYWISVIKILSLFSLFDMLMLIFWLWGHS